MNNDLGSSVFLESQLLMQESQHDDMLTYALKQFSENDICEAVGIVGGGTVHRPVPGIYYVKVRFGMVNTLRKFLKENASIWIYIRVSAMNPFTAWRWPKGKVEVTHGTTDAV